MDFWISEWISGFQSGFLDFSLDFWVSIGFLLMVYEISFVTDPSVFISTSLSELLNQSALVHVWSAEK